ncbi:alpha/beta-hydrolase [Stipitochalara longipes BDJ]|nr:alpha/beta-hydrolase [Stipitochalara longipes BDJ]
MSALTQLFTDPPRNFPLIIGTSVATTLAVITLTKLALQSPPKPKLIPSPRETLLPTLTKGEQDLLSYPPDLFPGARDVTSPYGTIRVYEWGPEEGRKVLMLHGISTPCLSLGKLAHALVKLGCRVLLLDLFGRGYSDSPADLPLDSRLYSTEILIAITSSPVAWTPGGFSIIGYSLGGGIAVDFTVSFPSLVKSLVLLAPAGLIRPSHFDWTSRFMYSDNVPDWLLEWAVSRRLRGGPIRPRVAKTGDEKNPTTRAEIKGNRDPVYEAAVLVEGRPHLTIAESVKWQLDHHKGFVASFCNSIKHSSIEKREESWRKLRERADQVLIIAGKMDPVIVADELREDVFEVVGEEKVRWRVVDSAHEFPVTKVEEVVEEIKSFWGL